MTTASVATSTRRAEILTGVIILGLSFGGFLLAEFGLRLMQVAQFGVQESVEASADFYIDEATGLRLIRPDRQLGQVHINNLGFRGPDVPVERPGNTLRLLFLGSSTTYDANVAEGRNWPHRTADLLAEALPGCRVDFVNAGLPGFSTAQMIDLYDTRLRTLQPDIAVILPGDVNHDLDWLAAQQGFGDEDFEPSAVAQMSVLWAKLEKNFRVIELQRQAFSRVGKLELELQRLTDRFRARLRTLTRMLQDDGVVVLVSKIGSRLRPEQGEQEMVRAGNTLLFYMPHVALPDILATRLAFNGVIEDVAERRGFAVLDGSLQVPADPSHYVDSSHFTPAGSERMAKATAERLLASPEVQSVLEARACMTN